MDGKVWKAVDQAIIFQGNTDQKTKVTNRFQEPVRARALRIKPLNWYNNIGMRFEAYFTDG